MMMSGNAVTAVREIVDPADFYLEKHSRIYRAALALADAGEPVDAITVTARLDETGELERAGGSARVFALANLVPASANAAHYATIVREVALRRHVIAVGQKVAQLGFTGVGDIHELLEQVSAATTSLERGGASAIDVETWAQFERSATEHVPTLVDALWPAGALGFIAAPPKKGKTWIGLSLAISVAAGTPFLGKFAVSEPQPVVLLAMEGHRAAIRGRIGALARGMGLNPDTGDLANLHIVYKPRGLNLADPQWVRTTRDTIDQVGAKLLIVDVLRAAAVLKENSNDEFGAFLHQLAPISGTGCSIALLHHFGKLTEITKERSPGERMAGAGAMYGAFDVGVFITGSDDGAKKLRIAFETRDLATPEPIGAHLDGTPHGINGGFIYTDRASWTVEEAPDETDIKAPAADIAEYVRDQGGDVERRFVEAHFEISDKTLDRRLTRLAQLGIDLVKGRGRGARSRLVARPEELPIDQLVLPGESPTPVAPDSEANSDVGHYASIHAGSGESPTKSDIDHSEESEHADLQEDLCSECPTSPTERNATADATHPLPEASDDIDWGIDA